MRKTTFIESEYYHVYNRGVDKRTIFVTPNDYLRFKYNLFLSNTKESFKLDNLTKYKKDPAEIFLLQQNSPLVSIHAYSLMPNHFHLLLSEKIPGGISLFMQKLSTAYTMYFNRRHDRSGSLFQGTFKSSHIDTDRYLQYIFAYIHANPFSVITEAGTHIKNTEKVLTYPHSSMLDYRAIDRPEKSIIDSSYFALGLQNDSDDEEMIKHLQSWLDYHPE